MALPSSQLNCSFWSSGLCQAMPNGPITLWFASVALPAYTTEMICCRSTHIESAFLTCGFSSSRFFGLRGVEFQVMFVDSPDLYGGTASPPLFFTALTAV